MVDVTNQIEVEGAIAAVIHVDDSGTETARTVLGLTTRDGLEVNVDEDDESWQPSTLRREQRIRTSNTIDISVESAFADDLEAVDLIGIVDGDDDGRVTFDSEDRKWGDDAYIELAWFGDEPDFETVDIVSDSEQLWRGSDIETAGLETDTDVPPTWSATFWIEGDLYLDAAALE